MADAGGAAESIELASVYINLVPALKGAPDVISRAITNATTRKASEQLGDTVVSGIGSALRKTTEIPAAMQALSAKLSSGLKTTSEAARVVGEAVVKTKNIIGETVGYVGGTWARVWAGLADPVKSAMSSAASATWSAMTTAATAAGNAAIAVGSAAVRMGQSFWAATAPARSAFASMARDAYNYFVDPAVRLTAEIGSRIGNAVTSGAARVGSAFTSMASYAYSGFVEPAIRMTADFGTRLGSSIVSGAANVRSAFTTMVTAARDNFVEPAVRMTADFGSRVATSVVNGANAARSAFMTLATAARDNFVEPAVRSVIDLGSRIGSAIYTASAPVRNAFSTLATAARDNFVEPAVRMAMSIGGRIGSAVGGAVSKVSDFMAPALERVSAFASAVPGKISAAFSTVSSVTSSAFSKVGSIASSAFSKVGEYASNASSLVKYGIDRTIPAVSSAASRIRGVWSEAWAKMPEPVHNMVSGIGGVFQGIPGKLGSALTTAKDVAGRVAGAIGSTISDAIGVGVKAAGVAAAGLGAVLATNLGGAIERADQLNNFPKVMSNIGFSSQEAAEQIKRISSSLDGLPTATNDIVRLAQSMTPLTGDLTSATDVSLALNNALLAGGASGTLAANAMEQYRQQFAVGKVDMMAWRSMTNAMPGQMDQLAKSILGVDANSQTLYKAMKDGTVSFGDFNNALLKLNTEGGEGFASFETQARSATGGIGTAITNVKNRIQKAMASIIEAIGVENISGKLNKLSEGFVGLGDKIAGVITKMKSAGSFESLKTTMSGLVPVFGLLGGSLGSLLTRIPLLGGAFSGLTAPVGFTIGLFISMWQQSEKLRTSVSDAFTALGTALASSGIQTAVSELSTTFSQVSQIIGDSLGKAIELVAPPLANMAETLLPLISQAISTLVAVLGPIVGTIIEKLGEWLAVIIPVLTEVGQIVIPFITKAIQDLGAFLGPLVDFLGTILVDAFRLLAAVAVPVFQAIGAVANWLWDNILGPVLRWMGEHLQALTDYLDQGFRANTETALTAVGNAWNWLYENAVAPFINWWNETAWPAIQTGWGYIVAAAEAAWPYVVAAWNWIWDAVSGFVTWWQTSAWPWIQWGWTQFAELAAWLWPYVVAAWNWITDAVSGFVTWWQETAWPWIQWGWTQFAELAAWLWPYVVAAWDWITDAVSRFVTWWQETAWPWIQWGWSQLAALAEWIWPIIQQAWNFIYDGVAGFYNWWVTTAWPWITWSWNNLVAVVNFLWPAVQMAWNFIMAAIEPVYTFIVYVVWPLIVAAWNGIATAATTLWTLIQIAWQGIQAIVSTVAFFITGVVVPMVTTAWNLISAGASAMQSGVSSAWGLLRSSVSSAGNWLQNTLLPMISRTWDGIARGALAMRDGVASAFEQVKAAAAQPINFVIRTVYTGGIKKLADSVMEALGLDFRMPSVSEIKFASGGVLPGYSPGRDIYHFTSTDGGGRLALSGGEAIMRPEWVKAVGGPRMVNAMNAAASSGHRIPGGDLGGASYQAFAPGGIWEPLKDKIGSTVEKAAHWVSSAAEAATTIMLDPAGAIETMVKGQVDKLMGGYSGSKSNFMWKAGEAVVGKVLGGLKDYTVAHAPKPSFGGGDGPVDMTGATDLPSAARKAIGTPYVWGGSSVPGGLDCSGLVYWAAKQLGWGWPRLTAAGYQAGSRPGNAMVPGNLLFWGYPAHHVAIASGGGRMIEAPTFGIPVREIGIYGGPSAGVYGYDSGGWLQPGATLAVNKTGQPEAVVTNSQWNKLDRLVDAIENGSFSGGNRELVIVDADGDLIGRMQTEAVGAIVEYDRLNH